MNDISSTKNTKMCDVCTESMQENFFERHKDRKTHL